MNCPRLKLINIPNSVTYFGASAFENYITLKTVQLPKGLEEIRNWTFSNCRNLQAISLEGVSPIAEDAFTSTPFQPQNTTKIDEDTGFICQIRRKHLNGDDNRAFEMLRLAFDKGCTDRVYELCLCCLQ